MQRRSRRRFLAAVPAAGMLALLRGRAHAQTSRTAAVLEEIARGAPIRRGRVKLELPVIAENGNAVPLKVTVESPMTEQDFVKAIHLVSDRNPVPHMAVFRLGPRAGRAEIATRVRLAGSQDVTAVAELSDGTFWMASSHIQVTLSACMDES